MQDRFLNALNSGICPACRKPTAVPNGPPTISDGLVIVPMQCKSCQGEHYVEYVQSAIIKDSLRLPLPFTVLEDVDGVNERKIPIVVESGMDGLYIRPLGYGDKTSAIGHGCPIIMELHNDDLRVVLTPDIEDENCQVVDLEDARESRLVFRVEYDMNYTGGDYSGVGSMVDLKFRDLELLKEEMGITDDNEDVAVRELFRRVTQLDPVCIVRYSLMEELVR